MCSFIGKTQAKILQSCQTLVSLFLAVCEYVDEVTIKKEAPHSLTVESWCARLWSLVSPEELCMSL